ncbi:MAG: ABC transporter ATP-binding protein [Candidatus Saccharimonadales bacterium]
MQKHIFSLFWRSAMKYPVRTLTAIFGASTASITAGFLAPFIIAQLLNQLQTGSIALGTSWQLIGLFALTQIYGEILGWRAVLVCTWTMETAAQRDLYKKIYTALTEQSLTFHANRFGGALVSQTTKLVGSFEKFWDTVIFQLVPSISSMIAAVVIMSFLFWQYAIVLAVVIVIFVITVIVGSRFLLKRNREEAQASTTTNAYIADSVTNVATIKSHGHESKELLKLSEKTDVWRDKSLSAMRGFLIVSGSYAVLMASLNIVAIIAAIWASEHNLIAVGTVYLSITYTFTVARQLWEMNNIMRTYYRIMGDAHDMTEILRLSPQVTDRSTDELSVKNGAVEFKDVTFTHDGNKKPLFNNFSLKIKDGERVGLVGHSGSGKTTLTRLLLRFDDIEAGVITIDGQDIAEVSQESLRKSIAYVPQEPMLFHRTLRENIAYGKPDATDAEITEAAIQANALEFITNLSDGFDTMVGERGVKLSGGQRQRVAIARAILKNAPILLLDEATSALDSESEKLIQDALTKLMKNRTSIVIAHRLSTIAKLDRIIVLDNGVVKEQGTHSELTKQAGVYAKLWSHQSGGFIEE